MNNFKHVLLAFFVVCLSAHSVAFDVGGLVSDGNGGWSDVGFDGIEGSGNLGLSDADFGGGFGVGVSGGTSDSGFGFGGEADSSGGSSQGCCTSATGMSMSQTEEAAREVATAVVTSTIQEDTRLTPEQKSHFTDVSLKALESKIDTFSKKASLDMATLQDLESLAASVNAAVTAAISQFSGMILDKGIDISPANVHENSENLVTWTLNNLKQSDLLCPLSRLGLKGVQIMVMKDIPGSFYLPSYDVIFLAKQDIEEFGLVPLYHELLHAGLYKAKTSESIAPAQFRALSQLNITHFDHLNGYVGTAQGNFEVKGYGFQEAFVIGWTFRRLAGGTNSIPNETLRARADAYKQSILDNKALTRLDNGKLIKVIDSKPLTRAQVRSEFLDAFLDASTNVRAKIDNVQSAVRSNLADLCVPGEAKVVGYTSCISNEVVYQKTSAAKIQVCGANMRFSDEIINLSCGNVVRYKDTGR